MSSAVAGRAPRFVVFGCGAVGSVFAARLASRVPVAVVARGARLAAIRRRGLTVEGATTARLEIRAEATAGDLAGFDPAYPLVTVTAQSTEAAAAGLEALGPESVRVSVQNGLGNEERLAAGGAPVIGAVNNNGATLLDDGRVFHAGLGEVILGGWAHVGKQAVEALQACLTGAGFAARTVSDIRRPLWEKAILNAATNPVTALLRLRTGRLLDDPGVRVVMERSVCEAVAVARADGVATSEDAVWAMIRRVVAATPQNKSSTLQDLERGIPTEVDSFTGVIIRRAARHGVATPWNALLHRLIRRAEHRSSMGPALHGANAP